MKTYVPTRRKYKNGSYKKFINEIWASTRPYICSEKLKNDIEAVLARRGNNLTLTDLSAFIAALNEANFKKASQIYEC